jgi:hypothetical protein
MLDEYPKEFIDSVMKPSARNLLPQTQYTRPLSSSDMLRALPRNSDASGTVSISVDRSRVEMPSRRSSVRTASHVIVADVTSEKQADL